MTYTVATCSLSTLFAMLVHVLEYPFFDLHWGFGNAITCKFRLSAYPSRTQPLVTMPEYLPNIVVGSFDWPTLIPGALLEHTKKDFEGFCIPG